LSNFRFYRKNCSESIPTAGDICDLVLVFIMKGLPAAPAKSSGRSTSCNAVPS
jgi:hypothetical protein